jgi:hypothetical protein
MLVTVLAVAALLLYLAIAVILVRKFIQTGDIGFIWLGGAVVIWPLLSKLLDSGERMLIDRTLNHQWTAFYPFTLVQRGEMSLGSLVASLALFQQLIGVCLLLIAVLYLSKTKTPAIRRSLSKAVGLESL